MCVPGRCEIPVGTGAAFNVAGVGRSSVGPTPAMGRNRVAAVADTEEPLP